MEIANMVALLFGILIGVVIGYVWWGKDDEKH